VSRAVLDFARRGRNNGVGRREYAQSEKGLSHERPDLEVEQDVDDTLSSNDALVETRGGVSFEKAAR